RALLGGAERRDAREAGGTGTTVAASAAPDPVAGAGSVGAPGPPRPHARTAGAPHGRRRADASRRAASCCAAVPAATRLVGARERRSVERVVKHGPRARPAQVVGSAREAALSVHISSPGGRFCTRAEPTPRRA